MITDCDENALTEGDTAEVARSSRVLTHPVRPVRGSGNGAAEPNRYETVVAISHTVEATCGRQRIAPIPLVQLICGHAGGEIEHRQTRSQDFGRRGHSQTTPLHVVIRLNSSVVAESVKHQSPALRAAVGRSVASCEMKRPKQRTPSRWAACQHLFNPHRALVEPRAERGSFGATARAAAPIAGPQNR